MTRAFLFVATVRRRSGSIQAVTAVETSRAQLRPWQAAQLSKLRAEHPGVGVIKSQAKDITDWLTNAAVEIAST